MNLALFLNNEDRNYFGLKDIDKFLGESIDELHLVHFMRQSEYAYQGDMIVPFYPNETQLFSIKKRLSNEIRSIASDFKNWGAKNVVVHIFEHNSPKRGAVKFINDNELDLAVCLTPKKEGVSGFFHSSFTNYLNDHSSVNILAIKD